MALRNSNNYKACIVPEISYGVINKTLTTAGAGGAKFFADKLEWNYAPITTELAKKENSLYKSSTRTKITGKLVTGTLSGDLTDGHEILLQAHFDDATSPYLYASALPTTKSYNIYQLYLDSAGAVTHYDVILGAIINPLVISGEPNGIIQYTATIEGADYLQQQPNSAGKALTLTDGTTVSGTPFLFGDVTTTTFQSKDTLLSFNLELRKTMVDNSQRFMNSLTKANDYYNQVGGTLQMSTLTNPDADRQSTRQNQAGNANTITLVNAIQTWKIDIHGVLTDITTPDADRGLFVTNETFELTDDISTLAVPVTITVTTL